tara:strand:- start:262 stop:699 length:438 start_codon:yes stop_codon:yes gene_type:complete
MNKKETSNPKIVRNQNYEARKMNTSEKRNKKRNKDLPWWVELLFVQIGLPDSLLIKILRTKKKSKEIVINNKKLIILILFGLATFSYFYPVIKHAKNKLDCEKIAKNYIVKNKNIFRINKRELMMLSTNFCYGGNEINEIENLIN